MYLGQMLPCKAIGINDTGSLVGNASIDVEHGQQRMYRFDEGILLDHESWFSVTPEVPHLGEAVPVNIVA